MDSIANTVRVRKGALGYIIEGQKGRYHGHKPPTREAGDIGGFSAASRKRLRMTLAAARHVNGGMPFGVTLTIPGRVLTPDETRKLWHGFVANHLKAAFGDCLVIWRVELQSKRKQAHWHCVVWVDCKDSAHGLARCLDIAEHWRRLVTKKCGPFSERTAMGFETHGVDVKSLSGASATGIIGYLCDHTSKHKQAQLGWRGRQWGVVNKDKMAATTEVFGEVTDRVHTLAARQYRRLQERLRKRGGRYTGIRICPNGTISTAIFGRDAERLMLCYDVAYADGHEYTPPPNRALPL